MAAQNSQLEAVRNWQRSLLRSFHRHKPAAAVGGLGLLVIAVLLLDLGGPTRDWLEKAERSHSVAFGLLQDGLVVVFAASLAYYLLWGLRCQRALSAYRALAREDPDSLVDGFVDRRSLVRRGVCERVAERIALTSEPSLTLVQGRASADRTSFVAGLTQALAQSDFVPIPLRVQPLEAFELRSHARRRFFDHIDRSLQSDTEADPVWRRARSSRDLILLVDGLDEEALDHLWQDDGVRFSRHLRSLLDERIDVVLVTAPRELVLPELSVQREQLDVFGRDEAETCLRKRVEEAAVDLAVQALEPLNDPVWGFQLSPFYLDVLVRLCNGGGALRQTPKHLDCWRASVLEDYIAAVRNARVLTGRPSFDQTAAPGAGGARASGR